MHFYKTSYEVSIDHFIPLSIGHGGTYIGNLFPVSYQWNVWKGNMNPFEWKRTYLRSLKSRQQFNRLVDYLAEKNKLSRPDFVYWCFNNPRSPAEAIADGNTSSIELWVQAGKGR